MGVLVRRDQGVYFVLMSTDKEIAAMTNRERALRAALTQVGVHEQGFSNQGGMVSQFEDADDLPGHGYPWCMSFVQWCFRAADAPLGTRTASVGNFAQWARAHGETVTSPERGDVVCFNFTPDSWPDHVGFVVETRGETISTVEGNTSTTSGGSQDNGGNVARKTRPVSRCVFVRVPGGSPDAPAPRPDPARAPKEIPDWWWAWAAWMLGDGRYNGHAANQAYRPAAAPRPIPQWAWRRLKRFKQARDQ